MSGRKEPQSILIVLLGAIGDVVRGLSLAGPLRKRYPQAVIGWVVEPLCRELVELHPGIDRIFTFQRERGVAAVPLLLKELRSERWELVLDLQRHFKSGVITFLSRGKRRIGFHRRNSKEGNWLFQTETITELSDDHSKLEHYRLFLRQLGIDPGEQFDFGIRDRALDRAILPSAVAQRFGVVVLGSSWESKNWPVEGYRALLELWRSKLPTQQVLVGTAAQRDLLGKDTPDALNLAGQLTLTELTALLAKAEFAVGPDSGPAHIAGAVGTPYVSLFGPTSPMRVAPYGSERFTVRSAIGCSPCYRRRCPGLNQLCMRLLTPAAVMDQIEAARTERAHSGAAG